ncbi:hypothetical protein NNRS527_01406 [Nitrosospira sp. NRS527]|nr:hypothetical protein NNRS527_01406 [Nitrosospira sp. NRS527]
MTMLMRCFLPSQCGERLWRKTMAKRMEKPSVKIGYARVSTDDQNLDLQMDALNKAGCERIFTDQGISGATIEREGLS